MFEGEYFTCPGCGTRWETADALAECIRSHPAPDERGRHRKEEKSQRGRAAR